MRLKDIRPKYADGFKGEPPFRRLHCDHYDECLQLAVDLNWPSWSCENCHETGELTPQQRYEQMFSLLELYSEVHVPSKMRRRGGYYNDK